MSRRFVPLGKLGVGKVKDHGGRLARILDQIEADRKRLGLSRDEKVSSEGTALNQDDAPTKSPL
jgi:hypothetical protein